MQEIRCSNTKCKKVVGELENGKARFKCKYCATYTTAHIGPAPDIQEATHVPERANAYVGKLVRG
jgi:hypothetical protein